MATLKLRAQIIIPEFDNGPLADSQAPYFLYSHGAPSAISLPSWAGIFLLWAGGKNPQLRSVIIGIAIAEEPCAVVFEEWMSGPVSTVLEPRAKQKETMKPNRLLFARGVQINLAVRVNLAQVGHCVTSSALALIEPGILDAPDL